MTTAGTATEPSALGETAPADGQETVIVGVDGSPSSKEALAWAARYAAATGATLRAVLAWHYPSAAGLPPVGHTPEPVTSQVEQSRYEILDNAIETACRDLPPPRIDRKVVYGHPAQALIDESRNADLLVVGSHGHGGFTGMMLGSVSTHCVTHASCPVTVVKRP
ncbi:MAG: universal stress protein [Nocardiopsaceae bacterium]|jgi:nucleotide-binding universal stress UspA family protein|nr:universal stress protein [Nocardiopsaceae bacterium]